MKRLWVLSFLVLLVSGCKSSFTDISKEVKSSNISLPESKHVYSATWLFDSTIVFIKSLEREDFDHDYLVNPSSMVVMDELYSYNIDTHEWEKFILGDKLNCHAQDINLLKRLPNKKLGLVQSCRANSLGVIRELDLSTSETRILFKNHTYPNIDVRIVGSYSFSPGMNELVQESPVGNYLNNELYYIKLGDMPQRIFPEFIRVMQPAWSPHNREIAFWGTESYYADKDPDLKTTWDITGLATYPWNLYISSPEGDNIHLLLASIKNPGGVKWSPVENIMAFSGTFDGVDGLWLFDPVSLAITRIWNERAGFDWSPDGTRIVISYADYSDYPEIRDIRVNIIQLP